MPTIAGPDQDGVDVLAFHNLFMETGGAAILVGVMLIDHLLPPRPAVGETIAHRHALHVFLQKEMAEIAGIAAAQANDRQRNPVAWRNSLIFSQH